MRQKEAVLTFGLGLICTANFVGCFADPAAQNLSNTLSGVLAASPSSSPTQLRDAINAIFSSMPKDAATATLDQLLSEKINTPDELDRLIASVSELSESASKAIYRDTTADKAASSPTVVIHINGILTSRKGLEDNRVALKRLVDGAVSGVETESYFNTRVAVPPKCVIINQALGKFKNKVAQIASSLANNCLSADPLGFNCATGWKSADVDCLRNKILRALSNGMRVILVPHSHGNCLLSQVLGGIPSGELDSIGVIMVGSPIGPASMRGTLNKPVSACGDFIAAGRDLSDVSCNLRGCSSTGLAICIFSNSLANHYFVSGYLHEEEQATKIRTALLELDRDLLPPSSPTCSTIPPGWGVCGCPSTHPCSGMVCNGTRYHLNGFTCDSCTCQ